MSKILKMPAQLRKEFEFRPGKTILSDVDEEGKEALPCITLYRAGPGTPVGCPGLEKYYTDLNVGWLKSGNTYLKRAANICSFLNYLLWDTGKDSLNEIAPKDLQGFIQSFRKVQAGEWRNTEEWKRGIRDVWDFLSSYRTSGPQDVPFQYDTADLYIEKKNGDQRYCMYGVKPPPKSAAKFRILPEEYLAPLLMAAEKYDPMLAFPIAMQAYAGLREGEVVNLCRDRISLTYGGFGTVAGMDLNLLEPAPFAKDWNGRRDFGNIKVPREQLVYPDFVDEAYRLYEKHDRYLASLGLPHDPEDPLLYNSNGKLMGVDTYCSRVKALFSSKFVGAMKKIALDGGKWAENAPVLESYEKSFPGCHMFRHYFTMYLLTHARLSREEIAKWRGDSSTASMDVYVHANAYLMEQYRKASIGFQRRLFSEVL